MLAEIIAIGDELTSGQRLDTNSQWLSQQLSDIGVLPVCHQTIADYLAPIIQAFRQASLRSDLVVVTGGLGPTADDLTRQALAEAFQAELFFDNASWTHIENLFKKRNYPIPESNRIQAMFPIGSLVIPNQNGTAPGIDWFLPSPPKNATESENSKLETELIKAKSGCRFFCLPGVPAEMKEMFLQAVLPRIQQWQGTQRIFIRRQVIKTFGAGESHIESMLPDLIRRGRDPQVGITASKATISLRIEAKGQSEADCKEKIVPVAKVIRETLGDLVYGEGDDELEDAVVPLLKRSDFRLVVVEWGTAGAVSQALHRSLGTVGYLEDSKFEYAGSVILSNSEAAIKWLSPDVKASLDFAPLSEFNNIETNEESGLNRLSILIRQLAEVAAKRFQATLAIACGPLPASSAVCINAEAMTSSTASDENGYRLPFIISAMVVADADLIKNRGNQDAVFYSKQFHVLGHQSIWQPRASKQVLNQLRLLLMGKLEPDSMVE